MDDNTKDVLVTLIQVGGGLVSGFILARFTVNRSDRMERERREREDRHRFTERKVTLAVDLLSTSDRHHEQSAQQVGSKEGRWMDSMSFAEPTVTTIPDVEDTRPVRTAWLALQLVAPGLAKEATRLYLATLPLGDLAAQWVEPNKGSSRESWTRAWASAEREHNDARIAYVEGCHRDLGVDPDRAKA